MNRMRRLGGRLNARRLLLVASMLAIGACSSHRAYDTAFSSKTALSDNSHSYPASQGAVFNAVKISLIQQGFEIDQADTSNGLLKGMRTFDDPKDHEIAYLVTLTADIAESSPGTTVLTAAASQKTVLNREVHKYYHLLGLLPIPTGREYQSVVRGEGNITKPSFYQDFFAVVSRNLTQSGAGPVASSPAGANPTAKPAPLRAGPGPSSGKAGSSH